MEHHSTPTPKLSGRPQQPPRQPAKFLRCRLAERPWLRQFNEERSRVFRAGHDTNLPESEVPSPGRWIRSGRHAGCGIDHALRRLSRPNPLRIPSGGGLLRRPRTEASPRRVDGAERDRLPPASGVWRGWGGPESRGSLREPPRLSEARYRSPHEPRDAPISAFHARLRRAIGAPPGDML